MVDVPSLQLLAKGYTCVAQESLIGIDIVPAVAADGPRSVYLHPVCADH